MHGTTPRRDNITVGLVVPFATDDVPAEGVQMYPDVTFIARGVGVRSLTPQGYDAAHEGILPAAEHLASKGVDAIMVIGTSLTFYRGAQAHARLLERLRVTTGLPVSTMSQAVVDGLRSVGARRIAVSTAYADEVNKRLDQFLTDNGFEVLALEGFGLVGFGDPGRKSEQDIIDLSIKVCADAQAAEGLLISCGGLRTLNVAKPIEARCGVPVVSSTQAAFWAALRLAGDSGQLAGYGRMLEQASALSSAAGCALIGKARMKARVTVTLKSAILDPQGKAIEGALKSLGVEGVASVRQGKVFDIELAEADRTAGGSGAEGGSGETPRQYGDRELPDRGHRMKSAVVVFPGINRERDMARTLKLISGREPAMVWHSDHALPAGTDLVVLPGGFSYGDYLRCGAIAARAPIMDAVRAHADRGGLVLGVCNGFQILCEAGLLPGVLMRNAALKFICKDVHLRVERSDTPFTRGYNAGQVIRVPVAHGEGNYAADDATIQRLEGEGRVIFRYVAPDGTLGSERGTSTAPPMPSPAFSTSAATWPA